MNFRAATATFGAAILAAAYPSAALPFGFIALVCGAAWIGSRPESAPAILLAATSVRIPLRLVLGDRLACIDPPGNLAPGPGAGAGLHLGLFDLLLLPALASLGREAYRRREVSRPAPTLLLLIVLFVGANLFFVGGWFRSYVELAVRLYLLDATLLLLLLAPPSRRALAWGATGWVVVSIATLALLPCGVAQVREGIRYAAVAGGANVLAGLLAVAFAIHLRDRPLWAVAALPVLFLTRGRGGEVAALVGGLAALAPGTGDRSVGRARWLALLSIPLLFLYYSVGDPSPALQGRLALPEISGAGLAIPVGLSTHVRLWAETGGWGVGALALWFLLALARARPDHRAGLVAIGVFSLFHETLRHPILYLLLAMPFFDRSTAS